MKEKSHLYIDRTHRHHDVTTAIGKAESAEEATVHVNDLDVFVTLVPSEDPTAVLFLVYCAKKWAPLHEWRRRISTLGQRWKVFMVQV